MAARLCYSAADVDDLEKKMTPEESAKLVRMLVRMGHLSTVEHVTFTFAIEGVSRVLTHQLVRHRIASYSQQSQRYVKAHNFQTVMPPNIAAIPEAKAKYEACMKDLQDLYNDLADNYGVPAEDARYVLPNAAETKIICTFNVRSLLNFSACAAAPAPSGKSASWPGACWRSAAKWHRCCLKRPARTAWPAASARKAR